LASSVDAEMILLERLEQLEQLEQLEHEICRSNSNPGVLYLQRYTQGHRTQSAIRRGCS